MPARQQATVWTNDGLFADAYMHHSASMISGIWVKIGLCNGFVPDGTKLLPESMMT